MNKYDLPMNIGTDRQLFLDELFFDDSEGIEIRVNPPHQDFTPVMVADRPWEQALGCYNTVIRENDRFRMWYDVLNSRGRQQAGSEWKGRFLCYAESTDGLHWEKPELELISFQGSKKNNIVAPSSVGADQQGGTVFRDDYAPAEERYKLWTKYQASEEDRRQGITTGLWAMVSPDGWRWRLLQEGYPLNRGNAADTQSVCFWDSDLGRYVGFVRIKKFPKGRQRTCSVGLMTSDDFRNWTPAKTIFAADERDERAPVPQGIPERRPPVDFYVPGGMKIPGVPNAYIILPNAYYHWREDAFPSTMDIRIAASRDLEHWRQPPDRDPFLRLGPDGSAAAGMIFATPHLVPVADELWIYYSGAGSDHRGQQGDRSRTGIFRAVLRRDGFFSADAGYEGGTFTTPELVFAGRRLELNMDGSAGGWLQVEIVETRGQPVPGFRLDEADIIRGNSVEKTVTWKGRQDVSALAGKPVRLRFVARSMKIFSFGFPDDRNQRQAKAEGGK